MSAYYVIYGGTADCYAEGLLGTYAASRAATTASTGAAATGLYWTHTYVTPAYYIRQVFFRFDTSAVPAGAGSGGLFIQPVALGAGYGIGEIAVAPSLSNKIAGASLGGLTLLGSYPFPSSGQYRIPIADSTLIPISATCNIVYFAQDERLNVAPSTADNNNNTFQLAAADTAGTTSDPKLVLTIGTAWEFLGVSNVVEVTATAHALVTTGIAGLAAGDLLVACISSRIASTASITLPTGGEWTLVSEAKNSNTATNTSATPSGMMAYCVRGASDPNLTFTHPVAPSVALGRIVGYRNVNTTSPKDTQTAATTATNLTSISVAGLTTTQADDLLVTMTAGGQEAAWSVFGATDPSGYSGSTDTTVAPIPGSFTERADSLTTTGADTSLAIFDAVKQTVGATGNFFAAASLAAAHVVVAGAFKIAPSAPLTAATKVKHAGTWKTATTHVKHAGVWKTATTHVKHAGTWKQV